MDNYFSQTPNSVAKDFGTPPRKVVYKRQVIRYATLGFAVAILAIALFLYVLGSTIDKVIVQNYGVRVHAATIDEKIEHSRKSGDSYYVLEKYRVQDQTYSVWVPCQYSTYIRAYNAGVGMSSERESALGSSVQILAATPTWNVEVCPDDGEVEITINLGILLIVLTGIYAGILGWMVIGLPLLQKNIMKVGSFVDGTITSMKFVYGRSSNTYKISYSYNLPSTGVRTTDSLSGTASIRKNAFQGLSEGEMVTIFYNPSKPSLSYPYEPGDFQIVR